MGMIWQTGQMLGKSIEERSKGESPCLPLGTSEVSTLSHKCRYIFWDLENLKKLSQAPPVATHTGQFFRCLPSSLLSGFFFHTWPTLGSFPGLCMHPSAKMDLKVKASGRSKIHYGLELACEFWLQAAFLGMCSVSLNKQGFFLSLSLP